MISRLGINPFRRLRDEEGGLSIVEVMVAAMLLVVGAIALFQLVDVAARTSYRAEQSQVSSNLLQRELERVKAAPREDIAVTIPDLNGCMTSGEIPDQFADRLGGDWSSASEFDGLRLVFHEEAENEGFPPCETVVSGDVTATVYRAIVWFNPGDDPDPSTNCAPPEDPDDLRHDSTCGMKRIYIGVEPETTASGGERSYREIEGEIIAYTADANFYSDGDDEED